MKIYLAIDPGRDKCGLAVLTETGEVLARMRCESAELQQTVLALAAQYRPGLCLLGNGTGSKNFAKVLREVLHKSDNCDIMTVDETATTEAARRLYWQYNPPTGWRRLLPLSLLVPPEPVDDWAAVALARRWLEKKFIPQAGD